MCWGWRQKYEESWSANSWGVSKLTSLVSGKQGERRRGWETRRCEEDGWRHVCEKGGGRRTIRLWTPEKSDSKAETWSGMLGSSLVSHSDQLFRSSRQINDPLSLLHRHIPSLSPVSLHTEPPPFSDRSSINLQTPPTPSGTCVFDHDLLVKQTHLGE